MQYLYIRHRKLHREVPTELLLDGLVEIIASPLSFRPMHGGILNLINCILDFVMVVQSRLLELLE